jgi:hypothetical protein
MTPGGQRATSNVIPVTIREIAAWALPHAQNTQKTGTLAVQGEDQ